VIGAWSNRMLQSPQVKPVEWFLTALDRQIE
jgi:hypothetical protein